jgi:hypothetical protein
LDARLRAGVNPEKPDITACLGKSVREFDSQLRLAYTAEAHERYPAGRLGTPSVDLVENVPAIDEIGVAAEGDRRKRQRWGLWSFCRR